jgi:ubiquinone/menaquinone biosynthesis C-methylase UbiE
LRAAAEGCSRVRGRQEMGAEAQREDRYWSRFATSYDRDGEYVVGHSILESILTRLSEERDLGDCLEFGCGTGYFTRALAGQARHVTATDLSDEMLQVARTELSQFRNVTVQSADCASSDFSAERFDSVLMANLVHVIANPQPCLLESYRVLKRAGLLIVVDFTGYRLSLSRTVRLGWRYVRRWGIPPRHGRNRLSREELMDLVQSAGFMVSDVKFLEGGSNALYLRATKRARPLII